MADEGYCEENDFDHNGDCDGFIGTYLARTFLLEHRPGEEVTLCLSHANQRAHQLTPVKPRVTPKGPSGVSAPLVVNTTYYGPSEYVPKSNAPMQTWIVDLMFDRSNHQVTAMNLQVVNGDLVFTDVTLPGHPVVEAVPAGGWSECTLKRG